MKIAFKLFCLFVLSFSAFADFSTIDFTVEKESFNGYRWNLESDDPRPLLYLITFKTEEPSPKNCDDGLVLFDTRDIIRFETGSFSSNPKPSYAQLCALTLQGFVTKRIIIAL